MTLPPPKRNNTKTVLIVVGIVLAVCCLGGIAGGVFFFRSVSQATGPAQDAATSYVDDIVAGRYSNAYGRLCDKVRAKTSEENFTRIQSAQLKVSTYRVIGTNVMTRNTTVTATVTMRMTQAQTGAEFTQSFVLLKEEGQWRVCE